MALLRIHTYHSPSSTSSSFLPYSPLVLGRIPYLFSIHFPSNKPKNENPNYFSSLGLPPFPAAPIPDSHLCRPRVSNAWAEDNCIRLDEDGEDLGRDGEVFRKTLRLVECAMLASVTGLTYILSNILAVESYFGCFFSLPIVISSMRWGVAAGRKTMVATAMLLLTLSGPVKATTYLLMHGFLGLTMGSLWRLGVNWGLSVLLCTFVRMLGAVGYVLVSSFLIRENILYLIAINIHASLMNTFAGVGINTFISMDTIYTIFGSIVSSIQLSKLQCPIYEKTFNQLLLNLKQLLLNCTFFVLLLHILYAVFLTKLGMGDSLTLPSWLQRAV